jgi:hypothetical protein
MKILLIHIHFHTKNYNAFMNYGFDVTSINHTNLNEIDLSNFDVVYSPHLPIQVSSYPNTKFIFGPHFTIFPNKDQIMMISGNNSTYIQPSEWSSKCWNDYQYPINIKTIPFGVDTNHFNETHKNRTNVFIYYKQRDPNELDFLKRFLNYKYIEYTIFSYTDKYPEHEYIKYLQSSKYGIILGRHESQGFAIEEAMSCNIPLLVWNVKSMNQEIGANYDNIYATSIPYWDNRCGEVFYDKNDLEKTFDFFISKLNTYTPRQYILENLSMEKCKQKFIELL